MSDLLTASELEALKLTVTLADQLSQIVKAGGHPDTARQDWGEAAALIHQIQNLIMSQAAARAYPDQFRLLGESFK